MPTKTPEPNITNDANGAEKNEPSAGRNDANGADENEPSAESA